MISTERSERNSIMDDKTMKKIHEALNIDILEKVNGGGGINPFSPEMDHEEAKEYVLSVAAMFGREIALDVADALGIPRYEAESWLDAPTES